MADSTPSARYHRPAARTVGRVVGVAGAVPALPWQTLIGAQRLDVAAMVPAAGPASDRTSAGASLRRPGWAMAVTAVLDVVVTALLGGSLAAAAPRVVLGAATAAAALVAGSRRGVPRRVAGLLGILTAVVQVGYTAWALGAGLAAGLPLLTLAPAALATASAAFAAITTSRRAWSRR